jgi:phosphate transport system substrate-binding protein
MDAFVFYVHADNPVDNLTTEQIRGIYSGAITDWTEVGAPESRKIVAYQRRYSIQFGQLMGGTPLMEPPKTPYWEGFARIGYEPADYRNSKGAIGYSNRFYATELLRKKQIKLLSLDGVAPTDENIRSGAYPFGKTMYMVTGRNPGSDDPRCGNVRKFMDYILSPEGQKLVEDTGYVPLGKTAENH